MGTNNSLKRVLSNSGWMMGQQIYNMLLQLVVGSISARYLGPSNYGLLNYSASIISFFAIVCRLGLDSVIINEMTMAPEKRGKYLGSALVMRLLTSVASFFLIIAIVRVLEPDNPALHIITLLQGIGVILQSYEVFTYWFQLNLRMKYVSIATMAAQTAVGIWRITLLATKSSVYFFAFSSSIQYLVCGVIVIYFFFHEHSGLKLRWSKPDARELIGKSYHFIISGLAITFYSQIDRIMIGKTLSAEFVGFYSAAAAIAAMWEFVPNALINSTRPVILSLRKEHYDQYIRRFQELLMVVTFLSIAVGVAVTLLGKLAILILYGESYLSAVKPLSILIWSTGFAMIGTARGVWIVAEGYNQYTKYYILIGAGVNLVLNLIFIPIWGITGAAIATLISQITVAFISPLFFRKTRQFNRIYFSSFRHIPDMLASFRKQLSPKQR